MVEDFVVASTHAVLLADGTVHAPLEELHLSSEDQKIQYNEDLIESGQLVPKAHITAVPPEDDSIGGASAEQHNEGQADDNPGGTDDSTGS